jgi:hypothetical protein
MLFIKKALRSLRAKDSNLNNLPGTVELEKHAVGERLGLHTLEYTVHHIK